MKSKKISSILTITAIIILISLTHTTSAQLCTNPPCDCDGDGYNATECGGNDCNDNYYEQNPGVQEVCGSGMDMNCNDLYDCYDPECCSETALCSGSPSPLWIDNDGDSYSICKGDCNDNYYEQNPGVQEVCGSGMDMNCNGLYDCYDPECCTDDTRCPNEEPYWWFDADHDTFKTCQNDCDDNNMTINPNAIEICDFIDNNCNGFDGFNNDNDSYTTCEGDCNDTNPDVYPNAAEICNDFIDNDCDEMIDCQDSDCSVHPSCEGIPEFPTGYILPIIITFLIIYRQRLRL